MGKDSSEIRREIEAIRARMGDTIEALAYKANVPSRLKETVNDRVETAKGTIRAMVANAKGAVDGATQRASARLNQTADRLSGSENAKQAAQRGVGIAIENPLGLALGAAALGFLAGLLVPTSDRE